MISKVTGARSSGVHSFVVNIVNANRLYNEPTMLLADEDAIYVLPISESGGSEID